MDAIDVRHRYKYGSSLCFSMMGRRKLRISMCAISTSPEAGDTTAVMSTRRKYSAASGIEDRKNVSLSKKDKNAHIRYVPTIPLNSINNLKNNVYEGYALSRNDSRRGASGSEHDVIRYGFPYYRSNRTSGSQDAVLLKDVGVSCRLLNDNTDEPDISISGFESYLVRQLKLEYNELSSITKKINAYTKDILSNLASRCKRKDRALRKLRVASKHVMASEYIDEVGNPCLKLRFCDNTEECRSSKNDLKNSSFEKEIARETYGKRTKKRRARPDKAFPKRILELSPKCSGLLLRNYLLMRREKVCSSVSKASLRKTEDIAPSNRSCRDHGAYKSRGSFYASKYDPLVLTNWKEVSRRKECRSKSAATANTSGGSRCTVSCL